MTAGPTSRRRRVRLTLRMRLTLVYGGLFIVSGLLLLGATAVLVGERLPRVISLIATSPDTLPPAPSELDQKVRIVQPDGTKTLPPGEAKQFITERESNVRDATRSSLLTYGGIALVMVSATAVGLGWLIAGRVLAPLHRVTETARRISRAPDRSLHERIALRGAGDEVKELADTFDTMIQRLGQSFEGQRRFVANASHELRTPLTLGRALVEVAMHRRNASPDLVQLGETLLEINTRHEKLINGLLLLARSDQELAEHSPVDLADVVSHVVAHAAAEAADAQVTLHQEPWEAPTCGDPVLLERLAQNLVENGIRHNTGENRFVRVSSRTISGDRVELQVSNSGPLIAPYDIPGLFEPFRRLNTDRLVTAKGVGLGLSIVASVVHAHGGTVAAHPRPEGGLIVTITLPYHALLGNDWVPQNA
ncbi:Signal transduction histidine kinase [Sinosporangium album]|uniref:histidine kinase n=1 Tax=Sinosporangium album TaxID=504805 RepID=A0A1G7Z092_9ACTN|nr:HAMP domain-containing sensor histidine kinase [Sinosporangium album]SDH02171.1 Signal transduction histidine kinase [Sinosporangium album]